MRGGTAGKAMWTTYFKTWSPVPNSIFRNLVADTRKRKGLHPEPPSPDEFIDKE
jgi:elongation factor 2